MYSFDPHSSVEWILLRFHFVTKETEAQKEWSELPRASVVVNVRVGIEPPRPRS